MGLLSEKHQAPVKSCMVQGNHTRTLYSHKADYRELGQTLCAIIQLRTCESL